MGANVGWFNKNNSCTPAPPYHPTKTSLGVGFEGKGIEVHTDHYTNEVLIHANSETASASATGAG